ncbi:glycine cleavage system protein R [Phenylobacterium sp. VNQ135]|uniref:glycine cleavage system protein R n=1 Tax=Phenylobacterium sp. VNQ135 TaxID=3400922 RepID=UPI003C116FBA
MTKLILSVTGSDRPGLTEALAAAVLAAGGNWLESHLSRLGGLYVGSVLVEVAGGGAEALRQAVGEVDGRGLEVRVAAALEAPTPEHGDVLALDVVGQDRPGIVHQVTRALTAIGVNIESFDTRLSVEAHSGAPLFHLDARVRLPAGVDAGRVQGALEAISAEIMVDIAVSPA